MPKRISVTYLPEPVIDPKTGVFLAKVLRPKIPIFISSGKKTSDLFHALVDSGSDRNLFPARLGELVGLDIENGKKSFIYGIGSIKITAYEHEVNLHFGRLILKAKVDFSLEQDMPLLGREGFFDLFKRIYLREKKKMIDFKV